MTTAISVYVEDPATALLTYDSIRLYRDTSPAGGFSTLVDTATLVSGTNTYTLSDSTGTASYIYRYTFYNTSGPLESSPSELFYPSGTTMLRLRLEAARQANVGFEGTCSADGTTTTLIDVVLRDTGVDSAFLEGAWIYRPNAAATGDKCRRVKRDGYDATTGTLSFDRAYTNLPASAEVYHVFGLLPPIDLPGQGYSWDRAIRSGLGTCWFVDELNLGKGTANRDTRFSLAAHSGYVTRSQIRNVWLRTTDTHGVVTDTDSQTGLGFWTINENGPGDLSIDLFPAPTTDQTVIAQVNRRDMALYNDTDVTLTPFDYAVRSVAWKAFVNLNQRYPGKYVGELAAAYSDWLDEWYVNCPDDVVVGM